MPVATESMKQKKITRFSCQAEHANSVCLAGTFNDWNAQSTPMRKNGGEWSADLELAPGRYEYKFVVDGQWCCEPGCEDEYRGCPKCVPNQFGTMNRLLEVS